MLLSLSDVKVKGKRQRQEFDEEKLLELMQSIKDNGQIHPIVVDTKHVLIAGERRLRAFNRLAQEDVKFASIEVKVVDPRDEYHREGIELEENIKRDDLTPADKAQAIARYHRLQQAQHGESQQGAKGGHGIRDTAKDLNVSKSQVGDMLIIDKILRISPHLRNAGTLSEIRARWRAEKISQIRAEIARRALLKDNLFQEAVKIQDGIEFLQGVEDNSVDLLIADIEYGIEVFDSATMRDYAGGERFSDEAEAALAFGKLVVANLARVLRTGSHVFIFCAWEQTFELAKIASHFEDLKLEPPWIWDRQNPNMTAVPKVRADSSFEYVMHFCKGSPTKPERLGKNILSFAKVANPKYPTEKPLDMMKWLIEHCTEEGGLVIDPCCGSGTVPLAALLTKRRAKGVDKNEAAIAIARSRIELELTKEMVKDANQGDDKRAAETSSDDET